MSMSVNGVGRSSMGDEVSMISTQVGKKRVRTSSGKEKFKSKYSKTEGALYRKALFKKPKNSKN